MRLQNLASLKLSERGIRHLMPALFLLSAIGARQSQ